MICWAEASRSLNGFSWMNMRAVFSDELPPVEPHEADDARNRRILLDDGGELGLQVGHGREGDVLSRLGLGEDEAGILLGEEALGDDRVQVAGDGDQDDGRRPG